ncbi:uncharacterized protein LOC129001725 isoform X2 [Macrosteles quadrilineatus]|uniref:uncharacterized protein LOC129001725 isoform X2 n=1 Tax=Macrosteles quadrilineatus TaxID=74068 RepID=UPI0023E22B0F|nr:uncharacterized protein LOC129001725 isoform X2 [Macrosteles quadrilineatus]
MSGWQGPPVLVGERTLWLGSGSGLPKPGVVRWIGQLPEIGPDWTVGLELDEALPFGGIDGSWKGRVLFVCQPKHGLLVPISNIIPGSKLKHIPNISGFEKDQNEPKKSIVNPPTKCRDIAVSRGTNESVINLPKPSVRQKRRIPTPPSSDSDEPVGPGVATEVTDNTTLRVEDKDQEDSLKKRLRLFTENNGALQRMKSYNECAFEEVVIDSLYAQRRQQFSQHGRSHSDSAHAFISSASSPGSRRERSTSAIFSIFRWFRRESRSDEFDPEFAPSAPPSPQLIRGHSTSCGSVDTLFSTATANSFAFIHPSFYRPFGAANPPEKCINPGPDTETYRNRLRQRDRIRELDKNLTLKKKYHLFGSGTLHRSVDDVNSRHLFLNKSLDSLKLNNVQSGCKNSTLGRKKRKAPPPPVSLDEKADSVIPPSPLDQNKENVDINSKTNSFPTNDIVVRRHRRTVSDSAKDRRSGAFVHVRGKRKAPPPPVENNSKEVKSAGNEVVGTQSLGRKKRHAPPPPLIIRRQEDEINSGSQGKLSPEEKQRLIENINKLQAHADRKSLLLATPPASPMMNDKVTHTVCNDSLKLERGVLKANKTEVQSAEAKPATPTTPTPVSPRPWYKRNAGNKEKSLEKRKEKTSAVDWMPEVAIVRRNAINSENNNSSSVSSSSNSHSNSYRLSSIFSRFDKPEEKRKSQISMLANISELDREAAEIVQREQEKERAMLAAQDAKYYTSSADCVENHDNDLHDLEIMSEEDRAQKNPDSPKKSGARELISLFNAIGNVTKVTMHSAFFSKDGPSIFSKEGIEKRFSSSGEGIKISEGVTTESMINCNGYKEQITVVETKESYLESPGIKRRKHLKHQHSDELGSAGSSETVSPRVVIEEIVDDLEKSKTQALYEANKIRKHHSPSPSIPTIAEMSESFSSVTASASSTINASERSSVTPTPTVTEPSIVVGKTEGISDKSASKGVTTDDSVKVRRADPVTKPPSKNYSIWSCPRCTLENPRWRVTCEACDMWRPAVRRDVIDKLTNANMGTTIGVNLVKGESKNTSAIKGLSSQTENSVDPKPNSSSIDSSKPVESKSQPATKADKSPIDGAVAKQPIAKPITVSGLLNGSCYMPKTSDVPENKNSTDLKTRNAISSTKETKRKLVEQQITVKPNTTPVSANSPALEKVNNSLDTASSSSNTISASGAQTETGVEEVRKARLAFFGKSHPDSKGDTDKEISAEGSSINQAKIDALFSIASKGSLATNEEERLKVKEILKEMKNSLPKKFKESKSEAGHSKVKSKAETILNEDDNIPNTSSSNSPSSSDEAARLGAIKKSKAQTSLLSSKATGLPTERKHVAEAYFIKSETIIEELKMKDYKSPKISTSVQTSGVVRKVESNKSAATISAKPPTPKSTRREITVPVTVEEHILKDGGVETTATQETKKVGIGAFKLIRPRDFANIKATKTGDEAKPLHVYVNVPRALDDDSSSSSSSDSPEVTQLSAELTKPKGLADFKASVMEHGAGNKMNTLAVNRLLRQLETAIAGGQHMRAATLAKQLARHKVNCCVTRHKQTDNITVDVYVEDRLTHQGPYPVQVSPSMTVAQLKAKVEAQFEIPAAVQRWILGKQLATDDRSTLQQHNVTQQHCPVFLYLVAPEAETTKAAELVAEREPEEAIAIAAGTTPTQPNGRGWYYNDEEDHYSLCESEVTEHSSKGSSPEPRVESPPEQTPDVVEEALVVFPVNQPEEAVEDVGAEANGAAGPDPLPTTTTVVDCQATGWKCTACTLINTLTRPGCMACGSDRPADYQATGAEQQRLLEEPNTHQAAGEEKTKNYQELMVLENADLIPSSEAFECTVCLTECAAGDGVVLRDCLHSFCRACLAHTVQFTDDAEVKCPFRDHQYACDSTLQEREIKALVTPEVYEQHLAKSVAQAENKIGNAFHCKSPDCPGWCIFEDNVNTFQCPVCNQVNCLTCQAIHPGMDCKQHQEKAQLEAETNTDARRTREMLEEMVQRGEALPCPTCHVVLMKKWGCDWLRCSMCKTEICWVTRGPRWGPGGKGDTSAGCKCGVNGVKCHPKCNYCH